MSTTTANFDLTATSVTETKPRTGLMHWLIKSREHRAEVQVQAAFARMPDSQLADIGFAPDQISHIRKTGKIPASYWA